MSSQLFCKKCDTLLHTSLNLSEPLFLRAQLESSRKILQGDGYALNMIKYDGSCPICGCQTNLKSVQDNFLFKKVISNTEIQSEHW